MSKKKIVSGTSRLEDVGKKAQATLEKISKDNFDQRVFDYLSENLTVEVDQDEPARLLILLRNPKTNTWKRIA